MALDCQPPDPARFATALQRFDEENACDPNTVLVGTRSQPRELLYAQWLSDWVSRLAPGASEALRLAARCQHLCRWRIPREAYPKTRAGYLQWREALKQFHAQKAGEILRAVGYPEELVGRVQALNRKQGFPADAETRVLEDALCLVFLEHQFEDLAAKEPEEKMLEILRKTWRKMTPTAQATARALPFSPRARTLLDRALNA